VPGEGARRICRISPDELGADDERRRRWLKGDPRRTRGSCRERIGADLIFGILALPPSVTSLAAAALIDAKLQPAIRVRVDPALTGLIAEHADLLIACEYPGPLLAEMPFWDDVTAGGVEGRRRLHRILQRPHSTMNNSGLCQLWNRQTWERSMQLIEFMLGLSAIRPDQLAVYQVCIRALLVFLILIIYVRIAKKRFLGQASGFDAILLITVGSLASRAISGTAPFFASLAGTLVLILAHWVLSFLTTDRHWLSRLVKGSATTIVRDGVVDHRALRSAHMSDDDLLEDLRQSGVKNVSDVDQARLERSGKLSVIRRDQ
jgi:hypothetical protein